MLIAYSAAGDRADPARGDELVQGAQRDFRLAAGAAQHADTFSLIGYTKVLNASHVGTYFANSIIVTLGSMALVLLFGAMAAWALTEYKFRGSTALALFLSIGIMVPIRLGSVAILTMMREAGLNDTLTALILVYVAQGLPMAIFILSEFIQQIPTDLRDAARCDGVPETRIFFEVIAPLLRPAIATVAVFTIVPIWNDLWFPLHPDLERNRPIRSRSACSSSSANTSPTGTACWRRCRWRSCRSSPST